MFKQANGSMSAANPRVLEHVAQHFDEENPLRPLIEGFCARVWSPKEEAPA